MSKKEPSLEVLCERMLMSAHLHELVTTLLRGSAALMSLFRAWVVAGQTTSGELAALITLDASKPFWAFEGDQPIRIDRLMLVDISDTQFEVIGRCAATGRLFNFNPPNRFALLVWMTRTLGDKQARHNDDTQLHGVFEHLFPEVHYLNHEVTVADLTAKGLHEPPVAASAKPIAPSDN